MLKKVYCYILAICILTGMSGCNSRNTNPKIGVSFGVGRAARWVSEKRYMEEYAQEIGADIEVRLNQADTTKTQLQDCKEMIDSGIDVLIFTPRDVNNVSEILEYAESKKVPVISYARVVLGEKVDLFVGYDSRKIGQIMGDYLSELAYKGDYIILRGDEGDNNATLLHEGAMSSLEVIFPDIHILLNDPVPAWSADEAKSMVLDAVTANQNRVDAILAPNDKIAGACVEAIRELGITNPVFITGMDAELDAVRRIVAGEQSMTIYMDLKSLSRTAVEQAYRMAKGEKVNVNAEYDNQSGALIKANLINGQMVTRENLDKILIDSGYFTREEVYDVD